MAANCTQCRQDCMGKAIALVKKDKLKASSREGQTAKNNYWLECNRNECDGKGQPCGPKE